MSEIVPGTRIDLIFESDYHRGSFRLFSAVVYEVSGRKIILSQTSQPLMPHHRGQSVMVTYCTRDAGQVERYGFSAKVSDLVSDYQIDPLQRSAALVLERKSEPEQMNVRLHFRVQPKLESGLALHYRGNKVNIFDISLGGARFSLDKSETLDLDDRIRLKLEIDEKIFDLEAGVVRSWLSTPAGRIKKVQFVAVKFLFDKTDLEQLLSNKIMAIQRLLLAEAKLRK